MDLIPCPIEIQDKFKTLQHNGFGFKFDSRNGSRFIITKLENPIDQNIIQKTGSKTLSNCDFIDNNYLTIHWTEINLIEHVLNSLLQQGISFCTCDGYEMLYSPLTDKLYSTKISETKFLNYWESFIKEFNTGAGIAVFIAQHKHAKLHEWNYVTNEGKLFCRKIREGLKKPTNICIKPEHNYLNWPIFKNNLNLTQITTTIINEQNTQKKRSFSDLTESEYICMICFVNPPDTIVNPCKHCVVCTECSKKLQNTNDRATCVYCRNPIDYID